LPDILILTAGSQIQAEYVTSLVSTLNHLLPQGVTVKYGNGQAALVAKARQTCYEVARQMQFERMVWIDSDMSWQVDDFLKLVATDQDVLTGAYLDELGQVVATRLDGNRVSREQLDAEEPFEIAWCGFGFVSLSKKIVAALPEPFIRDGEYGEDVAFCKNAHAAGFSVWLDPTIRATHHKTVAFSF
jgi:hypothetical protein